MAYCKLEIMPENQLKKRVQHWNNNSHKLQNHTTWILSTYMYLEILFQSFS